MGELEEIKGPEGEMAAVEEAQEQCRRMRVEAEASLKELQEARGGASYATRATRKQGKYTAAQQEAEAALTAATARLEAAAAQLAAVELHLVALPLPLNPK